MVGSGNNSQNAPLPAGNVTFPEQQFETALNRILDRILARSAPPPPALNVHPRNTHQKKDSDHKISDFLILKMPPNHLSPQTVKPHIIQFYSTG